MTLPYSDLFTPSPSGVGPNPPPTGSWLAQLLTNASTLQLATTSWQSGGMGRTIMAIMANALMLEDVNTAVMNQGGFLDYAATGTVAYVDPNTGATITQYVTPDPSNPATWPDPSTTPGPGWLDLLATGYGLPIPAGQTTPRIAAARASGPIRITSANPSTFVYQPGTYHVANAAGYTYSNVSTLTIAPGNVTATFQADIAGKASTSLAGTITTAVTSLASVSVTNTADFIGSDPESNTALALRCRLKLQSLSTGGTSGAYEYWALTASQVLLELVPPISITPITQATPVVNTATGAVQVLLATDATGISPGNPIVPGVAGMAISGATNASPIVLTVSSTGGLTTGMPALVEGVSGNTAANGYWSTVTVVDGTHISLDGSTGNGAYTTGGVISVGPLGLVDSVINSNATPLAVTEQTLSAIAQGLVVAVGVSVPAGLASTAPAVIQTAIVSYVQGVPIGGYALGVPIPNSMPIEGLIGAIYIAAPYVRDIAMTLNGLPFDVAVGALSKLVLVGTPTITVTTF